MTSIPVKILKKILFWIPIFLGLVVVLAIGAVYGLQYSDTARQTLIDMVSELASSEDFHLELEGLSGKPPWDFSLKRAAIADREGVYLTAQDIEIKVRLDALLDLRLALPLLRVGQVIVSRTPAEQQQPDQKSDWRQWLGPYKFPKLTVDRLVLEQITVTPPLVAVERSFAASGDARLDGSAARINLRVQRQGDFPDHAALNLELNGKPAILGVNLDFVEEPGGLVGEMIGLPPSTGLKASLIGNGPIRGWSGKFSAEASGIGQTQSDLTLAVNKTIDFSMTGHVSPIAGFLPPVPADLVGDRVDLSLRGRLDPGKSLALETMDLNTPQAAVHFQGGLDLKDDVFFGAFQVDARDGAILKHTGLDFKNGLRLDGRLSGSVLKPAVTLDGLLREPAFGDISAQRVTVRFEAEADHPLDSPQAGFTGRGKIAVDGISAPGMEFIPQNLTMDFQAALEKMKTVIIPQIDLQAEGLRVRGSGGLSLDSMDLDAKLELDIADLARISPLVPGFETVAGSTELRISLKGKPNQPIDLAFTGTLNGLTGMPEPLPTLMGTDLNLSLTGSWESPRFKVTDLEIKGKSDFGAAGWIDPMAGLADLSWRGEVNGLGEYLKAEGITPRDPIRVKGVLTGALQAPAAKAEADIDDLNAVGFHMRDIVARLDMEDLSQLKGHMRLTAAGKSGIMEATAGLILKGDSLKVAPFKMNLPGMVFSADLGIDLMEGLLDGQAVLKASNLAGLSQFLDRSTGGTGDLRIRMKPVRGKQSAQIEGGFKNVSDGDLRVAALNFKTELSDLSNLNIKQLTLSGQGFSASSLRLTKFDFRANGSLDRLSFKVAAEGDMARPIRLDTEGLLVLKSPGVRLTLQQLRAAVDSVPINLVKPASVYAGGGGFGFDDLTLKIGTGRVTGSGRVAARDVSANLSLQNIPLSLASLFSPVNISGAMNGHIKASGDPRRPNLSVALDIVKIMPNVEALSGFQPADLHLDAALQPNGLVANVKLTGLGTQQGQARLVLPLRLSLQPFAFNLPQSGRLDGALTVRGDLRSLPASLGLDDQIIAGLAVVDLTLTGTVGKPQLAGGATLENGYYENIGVGVILKNITAKISGDGNRLNLVSLSATDGEKGRLNVSGSMDLDSGRGFPFKASAEIEQAEMLRMDLLRATANGKVSLDGDTSKAKLSGNLVVAPATMNLVRIGPGVTNLEITKINTGRAQPKEKITKTKQPAFVLELDLKVDIPGRFMVRGYGLDSEWAGNLAILGNQNEPRITGRINAVRGLFELAGRRFNLSKGILNFTGASPPAPIIDATATATINDLQAVIQVSGSATSPEIFFESTPSLPQEEIMAQVLFGKSASTATPGEALRLAAAANQLRGKTGLDIVGKFRSLFNLDKLDVGMSEGGGATVGAGKYISDKVYLEVQHDTVKSGESVLVEIELSPRLSLDSKASPDEPGEIGLNWKKDY